jgi:hypothetical protein
MISKLFVFLRLLFWKVQGASGKHWVHSCFVAAGVVQAGRSAAIERCVLVQRTITIHKKTWLRFQNSLLKDLSQSLNY